TRSTSAIKSSIVCKWTGRRLATCRVSTVGTCIVESRKSRTDRSAGPARALLIAAVRRRERSPFSTDRLLLLCSRQAGKSTVAAALALQTALLRPRSPVFGPQPVAAPVERAVPQGPRPVRGAGKTH